jgi:hypothetical protein
LGTQTGHCEYRVLQVLSSRPDLTLLFQQRGKVTTQPLPEPPQDDYRHHEYFEMAKRYGGFHRCGVFHLCYWIPQGQRGESLPSPLCKQILESDTTLPHTEPCLSEHICSGCYRHQAVSQFLESCWGFQQLATGSLLFVSGFLSFSSSATLLAYTSLQVGGKGLVEQYQAIIQKVQEWEPGFHIFGETSYLGMAVLHNLQVKAHVDPGDERLGFVVMTNWGHFKGESMFRVCRRTAVVDVFALRSRWRPRPTHHEQGLPCSVQRGGHGDL